MESVSQETRKYVVNKVRRDLDPPFLVLHAKLGLSVLLGLFLSLIICGQFGLGFTRLAQSFSHHVHTTMDPWKCAIICGTVFSFFPVVILKFITSPIQFRVIFKKKLKEVALWILTTGVVLSQYGHHGKDVPEFATWLISAIVGFYIFAKLKDMAHMSIPHAHHSQR